jgi:hypothetical protein
MECSNLEERRKTFEIKKHNNIRRIQAETAIIMADCITLTDTIKKALHVKPTVTKAIEAASIENKDTLITLLIFMIDSELKNIASSATIARMIASSIRNHTTTSAPWSIQHEITEHIWSKTHVSICKAIEDEIEAYPECKTFRRVT